MTGMSAGGTLIDIAVGKPLCIGIDYTFSFRYSDTTTIIKDSVATTSDNGVLSIKATSTDGSYILTGNKEGESILKIYDGEGILHYRNLITVRHKILKDDLDEFMVNTVDHFVSSGYNGKANITFIGDGAGLYSGYDGTTKFVEPIQFTYEYTGVSTSSDDEYCFTVTSFPNTYSDLVLASIYMDFTGGLLHPVDRYTLVDFFTPVYA